LAKLRSRHARVLARWIMASRPKTINSRDLRHDGALTTKEAARYDAALTELAAAGWIRTNVHHLPPLIAV
jgi:hypothetical protein